MNLHRILLLLLLPLAACWADSSRVQSTLKRVCNLEKALLQETNGYGSLDQLGFEKQPGMFTEVEMVGDTGFVATTCDLVGRTCMSTGKNGKLFVDSASSQAILEEHPRPIELVAEQPAHVSGKLHLNSSKDRLNGEAALYYLEFTEPQIWAREASDSGTTRWISGLFLEPNDSLAPQFSRQSGSLVAISGFFRAVRFTPTRFFLSLDNPQLVP